MSAMRKRQILWLTGLILATVSGFAQAQTATINWTNVHQVIDGFGASDASAGSGGTLSTAQQSFFFGTDTGQLGLSLLRVSIPNNDSPSGDCTSVSSDCAGSSLVIGDMQAVIANGGRVYATPWSPPATYMTNGSVVCSAGSGNGQLIAGDYAAYATWLSNYVKSLQTIDGISVYAITVQNEPDWCPGYAGAVWSAANIDTFVKTNLGPTFTANGLSTLIFAPEAYHYGDLSNMGGACATDSSCASYLGGVTFHDYDAGFTGSYSIGADPYPSGWPNGKKYWETESSCGTGYGPGFCAGGFNAGISQALDWAALIDQRIAGDNANAWLYWLLIDFNYAGGGSAPDDSSLMNNSAGGFTVADRAYILGQYSRFVRPGYYRIDSTRAPQTGVSVSAYQSTPTNTLVIIATNYTSTPVTQTFNITNSPTFSTLTPTITSASQQMATLSTVSVSSGSFTYTLPAQSITTFAGSAASIPPPTNLAGTVVQ